MFKKPALWALLILVLVMSACKTLQTFPVPPRDTVYRDYTLNVPRTVSTGSNLFRVSRGARYPVFTVTKPFQPPTPWSLQKPDPLVPGHLFKAIRSTPDGGFVIESLNYPYADRHKLLIHIGNGGVVGYGWLSKNFGSVDGKRGQWPMDSLFVEIPPEPKEGDFVAEMVYMGSSGSIINLLYREYKDNYLRPDFSQELHYDLAESKRIKFRSVSIEVEQANNSEITYAVAADENLPWLPR